jgi:hypothetical protein
MNFTRLSDTTYAYSEWLMAQIYSSPHKKFRLSNVDCQDEHPFLCCNSSNNCVGCSDAVNWLTNFLALELSGTTPPVLKPTTNTILSHFHPLPILKTYFSRSVVTNIQLLFEMFFSIMNIQWNTRMTETWGFLDGQCLDVELLGIYTM